VKSLRTLFLTAVFLLTAGCGQADPGASDVPATHPLLSDGACGSCRIVAETLAVIGQEADTIAINEGATPVVDSRGRFYVLEKGGASVLVFGPDGRLMQSFGRPGTGPGEFRRIGEIHVAQGDTLLLLGAGVLHVIAPDYRHVRQAQVEMGYDAEFFNTILADGRVLRLSGEYRFRVVDRDGGSTPPIPLQGVDTARCNECGQRTFREGIETGTVWSGQQNNYRIERHDLNGSFLQGFTRRVHWFPEWRSPKAGEPFDILTELSRPRMFGVRQTTDGLLWTHVLMIDDPDRINVNQMMTTMNGDENSAAAKSLMSDVMSNFVTMVEVVDPSTREVLAGRELKMIVVPMLRDMVAQMKMDKFGDWSIVVMRLKLEGR
jgi:hypothetical protein